jgi:hypothetical protein
MTESILDAEAARGRAEGYAEGYAEGVLNAYRYSLVSWLSQKFGPLPETIRQRIEACTDIVRLGASFDRVWTMKSLDEFDL